MKNILVIICAAGLTFTSCNQQNNTADNTATSATETANLPAMAPETDYDADYQAEADRMTSRLNTDMQFDTATQSRVKQAYFNRARRLGEMKTKYSNVSGTAKDTTGMYSEMHTIDTETENELRGILKPEQYKLYESSRTAYQSAGAGERKIKRDGDEITVKTEDIKIKAEPGKSKVETDTYESKIKGDKRKFKSDDVKIKSEPGKIKIKTDDKKVKIKEDQ